MTDDHAQTEIRPRYPLPPAPARHLPVAQPDSRYSRGIVVVGEQMAPDYNPPSGSMNPAATVAPHPVDVRRPRATSHRVRTSHVWEEYWFGVLMGFGLGVIGGVLGAALFTWWTS